MASVAIGRLWHAEKFSPLIQQGQDMVNPQTAPDARSRVAAAPASAQVFGATSGSRPASLDRLLLYYRIGVEALNGNDSMLPATSA